MLGKRKMRPRMEQQAAPLLPTLNLFPHGAAIPSPNHSSGNGLDEDKLRAYYDSQPPITTGVPVRQHFVNGRHVIYYDFIGDVEEPVFESTTTTVTDDIEIGHPMLADVGGVGQEDRWKITKVLTASDVNGSSRLLLLNDQVTKHVFKYINEDEITINGKQVRVWDEDQQIEHTMRIAKWMSSGSYVLKDGWKSKIVDGRRLKRGDKVGFYWDTINSRFVFSVLAVSPPPSEAAA